MGHRSNRIATRSSETHLCFPTRGSIEIRLPEKVQGRQFAVLEGQVYTPVNRRSGAHRLMGPALGIGGDNNAVADCDIPWSDPVAKQHRIRSAATSERPFCRVTSCPSMV